MPLQPSKQREQQPLIRSTLVQTPSQVMSSIMDRAKYTVGWIALLPLELAAAKGMLEGANTMFVMGVQPKMGGGVPSYGPPGAKSEIVLGDVVVSVPFRDYGGVVRYDFGAWIERGHLEMRGHINGPSPRLLETVKLLKEHHQAHGRANLPLYIQEMRTRIDRDERDKFEDPGALKDNLFVGYDHPERFQDQPCEGHCDPRQSKNRESRGNEASRPVDTPKIQYGNIASSNQLQISECMRENLQKKLQVICFEMEGAGVIQGHDCLVVRGICDYSDSHKNKTWQYYAAATAAAYAKEFLRMMPKSENAATSDPLLLLKEYYFKNDLLRIERLSGALLDMEQCYINLTIVEHKKQLSESPTDMPFSLFSRLKVEATVQDERISLPSLFEERKLGDKILLPKRIFIRGRAGVGKTTLCKKIVHDYFQNNMWKQWFDCILWIPLRRLKTQLQENKEYRNFGDIFYNEYFLSHNDGEALAKLLWSMVSDHVYSGRILFILDGMDEVSRELKSGTDTGKLLDELLAWPQVIVTSRPLGRS
ncbi:predicted protein [Histoplasma mississippiense (nom. inval.)]|uniref:predicted protein n=1 Tax=Ajellomyces capsulatus (strain NAm1 / WU24) TaxID=2059318 RepID=UPI000157CFDB|nr:predicted protein [Histoplasma mississippiense (nom. inval.)]EDN10995.1 predicted protein [Histoplasma mississippiense (nom. inval.)]